MVSVKRYKTFSSSVKGAQSQYFELFWASTKLLLNWRKPENNTLQRWKNIREMIINHKGTRMVKDGEDWHGLQTANLKSLAKLFKPFNRDWAPLIKAGFHLKAVFMSLNVAFVSISRSRFKQCQIAPLRTFTNVLGFCVNFWMIFGHSVNEIFFSKDWLNWGKYEMLKIWWIWKIEFWSEELIDGHQTVPYKPGALFRGGQLSGRVPNPF